MTSARARAQTLNAEARTRFGEHFSSQPSTEFVELQSLPDGACFRHRYFVEVDNIYRKLGSTHSGDVITCIGVAGAVMDRTFETYAAAKVEEWSTVTAADIKAGRVFALGPKEWHEL